LGFKEGIIVKRRDLLKIFGGVALAPVGLISKGMIDHQIMRAVDDNKLEDAMEYNFGLEYDMTENVLSLFDKHGIAYKRVHTTTPKLGGKSYAIATKKMKTLVRPSWTPSFNGDDLVNEVKQHMKKHNVKFLFFLEAHGSPLVYNPTTFEPRRAIILRYASVS